MTTSMDAMARDYVRLVLATGEHDEHFVDAYFGPEGWRDEIRRVGPQPPETLLQRSRELRSRLRDEEPSLRREFLAAQLQAVETFLRRLSGETFPLDEEARLTYDLAPASHPAEEFRAARDRLERLLPGEGPLAERIRTFRTGFVVPQDRLEAVADRALAITRKRTLERVSLPGDESFRISYVRDRPWSAYNWYEGGHASRIEVNLDLPIELAPILRTLAHEGYPGHHTYNVLLESRLVEGKGWRELQVHPLFSPQSLLAEGTANAGISVIFSPDEEWRRLEGDLAPIAGLPGRDWRRYRELLEALRPLRFVRGEAARLLLDRGAPTDAVLEFLMEHGLQERARAEKALSFIRTYRSYVFNYTDGEDLILAHIGSGEDRTARFFDLLQRSATPAALQEHG